MKNVSLEDKFSLFSPSQAPFRPVSRWRDYHTLVSLKRLKSSQSDYNNVNIYFETTFSLPSPLSLLTTATATRILLVKEEKILVLHVQHLSIHFKEQ